MKPQQVGLLALGATLAGGLAYRMTQQPLQIPDPAPLPRPVAAQSADAPGVRVTKPSPLVAPAERIAPPVAANVVAVETAPTPVYQAAPADRATSRVANVSAHTTRVLAPHPTKPVIIATVKTAPPATTAPEPATPAKVPPTQWLPGKYEEPSPDAAPKQPPAESAAEQSGPAAPSTLSPVEPPADVPNSALPRRVTLQTGMSIAVRLDESLSSSGMQSGDVFQASLAEPLIVDRLVIAERGARVAGRVVDSGRGLISLGLTAVFTSDGQRVSLLTDPWTRESSHDDNFFTAIFRRPAVVRSGSILHFRLSNRITVTEQLAAR